MANYARRSAGWRGQPCRAGRWWPQEVVCDPDLSINEKRALLASWASDACAVEAMPGLRKSPAGTTVSFDDIMDALKELDAEARQGLKHTPKYRRLARHGDVV
jgi:hypothetical protein